MNEPKLSLSDFVARIKEWYFFEPDELYDQPKKDEWSLALAMIGVAFLVLRRISPLEILRHGLFGKDPELRHRLPHSTPLFNDVTIFSDYILFIFIDHLFSGTFVAVIVFVNIAQTLQANLFSNLWRAMVEKDSARIPVFHPMRNVFFSVTSYLKIVMHYSFIYRNLFANDFTSGYALSLMDSYYFSFVTMATVGFGDLVPKADSYGLKAIIMTQIAASFVISTLVIAITVASAARLQSVFGRTTDQRPPQLPPDTNRGEIS